MITNVLCLFSSKREAIAFKYNHFLFQYVDRIGRPMELKTALKLHSQKMDPWLVCLPRGAALASGPFRGAAPRGRPRTCLVVSPASSHRHRGLVASRPTRQWRVVVSRARPAHGPRPWERITRATGAAATIATRMGGDAGLPGTAAPARGQLRRALERDPTEGRGPPWNLHSLPSKIRRPFERGGRTTRACRLLGIRALICIYGCSAEQMEKA